MSGERGERKSAAADTYPLAVLAAGGVQRLDQVGGVADEEGVAGRARDHGDHGQPQVRQVLRRESPVADAQHVGHGLEERPRILLQPVGFLQRSPHG